MNLRLFCSISVVRPVPLQPWRTRARNAGSLPTGTLARNQSASMASGKADAVEKHNVAPALSLSSNNHATEALPSMFPESTKRKRPIRQRSRSSSSSSSTELGPVPQIYKLVPVNNSQNTRSRSSSSNSSTDSSSAKTIEKVNVWKTRSLQPIKQPNSRLQNPQSRQGSRSRHQAN